MKNIYLTLTPPKILTKYPVFCNVSLYVSCTVGVFLDPICAYFAIPVFVLASIIHDRDEQRDGFFLAVAQLVENGAEIEESFYKK